jgi:hypothetical protein
MIQMELLNEAANGADVERDPLVSAEALVKTDQADRYLAQLSRHASQMSRRFGPVGTSHQVASPPQTLGSTDQLQVAWSALA